MFIILMLKFLYDIAMIKKMQLIDYMLVKRKRKVLVCLLLIGKEMRGLK